MLELSVLVDNNTLIDRYFQGEPGVSYHLRDGGTRILFDCGYSDAFIRNAEKMGIHLLDLDSVVLSHGHLDHTWGLYHLIKLYTEARMEKVDCDNPTLVAHPSAFLTRTVDGIPEIGSLISEDKLSRHFDMRLERDPLWLTDNLVFLGEIERTNDFEAMAPIGRILRDGTEEDDYVIDDSALVYTSPEGLRSKERMTLKRWRRLGESCEMGLKKTIMCSMILLWFIHHRKGLRSSRVVHMQGSATSLNTQRRSAAMIEWLT